MNLENYIDEVGTVSFLKEITKFFKNKEQLSIEDYEQLCELQSSGKTINNSFKDKKFSSELIIDLQEKMKHYFKIDSNLHYYYQTENVNWEVEDILQHFCTFSISNKDDFDFRRDVKTDVLFKISGFHNKSVFDLLVKEFENILTRVDKIISEPDTPYGLNVSKSGYTTYNTFKYNENLKSGYGFEKTESYLRHLTGYNKKDYEILLDCLSLIILGKKYDYALVFLGGKSLGKDMLIQIIRFMTKADCSESFGADLDGYFNNPYKARTNLKPIVYFNELAGDNLGLNIEKLKNDITSTERFGREIYGKASPTPNITNIIIASNNLNLIDYIPSDNRRMCIFDLHVKKIGKLKEMVQKEYDMEIKPFRNEIAKELGDFRDFLRNRKVDINEFIKTMDNKCSHQKEDRVYKLLRALAYSDEEAFGDLVTNHNVKMTNEDIEKLMACSKIGKKALSDLIKLFKKGFKSHELANYKLTSLFKAGKNTTAPVLIYDTKKEYFSYSEKQFKSNFYAKVTNEEEEQKKDYSDMDFDFIPGA